MRASASASLGQHGALARVGVVPAASERGDERKEPADRRHGRGQHREQREGEPPRIRRERKGERDGAHELRRARRDEEELLADAARDRQRVLRELRRGLREAEGLAPREVLAQQRAHVRAPQPRACRCADKEASTTPPPRQRNEPPPRIVGRAGRADARCVARGVVEQRAEQQRRRGHDDARAQRADERDGARRAVARVGEAVEGEEGDGRGGEGGCAGRPGSPGGASYCIPRWAGCGPQVGDIHPCLLVETSSPQFVCSVKSKFFRGCDTSGSPGVSY